METVRSRLYRFPPFFLSSRRMAPINLSLRVSRPSLFRIVPGGRPFFFSNVPTVQSLRVCLAMENLLSKTLKWTESEMNGYCRFADLTVVLILNGKLKFQPCNFGKVADIELIGDFDVKNRQILRSGGFASCHRHLTVIRLSRHTHPQNQQLVLLPLCFRL